MIETFIYGTNILFAILLLVAGVYSDFASGSNFRSNELFSAYPDSLQIVLGTDDFDVCNGLGSKSSMHKLCPVYMSIKNIPHQFTSRLNSISLVSLCYSDDLNTKYTDFNDIWRLIVKDISNLEDGIDIGGKIIRGTVTYVASDNLGIHTAYGLVKNFSTTEYCCRFCTCTRSELQTLCVEDPSKLRTIEHYNKQIEKINDATKVDFKETFGIARFCVLNDLKYFHMISSMVPDIMHDILEGTAPFVLKHLFEYFINEKIFTEKQINDKIQYFDYGRKKNKQIPSIIGLQKRSLGQNATQMLCLLQHLPYIFYHERNQTNVQIKWTCVQSLLRVVQIVNSSEMDDDDINDLKYWVKIHLNSIQSAFEVGLLPKHHFMTHYAGIILAMGPLKPMSMMRYEGYHKVLKGYANHSQNFTNITKTITHKNQQHICEAKDVYTDHSCHSKKTNKVEPQFVLDHTLLFQDHNISDTELYETQWMQCNSSDYRKGAYVISHNSLYEIQKVLIYRSEYYLFCIRFNFVQYDEFLNSIEIKKSEPVKFCVIKFDSLKNKFPYETKLLDERLYIILETLNLKPLYT